MLRVIGCTCFAALTVIISSTHSFSAAEPWLQNYFDANGGCGPHRNAFNLRLERLYTEVRRGMEKGDPDIFGKSASNWTDQDISDTIDYYIKCELLIDVRSKACKPSSPGCGTELNPYTANQAKAHEGKLKEIISIVRERTGVQRRQEAARHAQDALAAIRREKMADEAARRSQQELIEQTNRDRAAAEEAVRRQAVEEPKVAEAVKEAEEARTAREAAERRLAEIRSRIDAENAAAGKANEQARVAENARQQTLREEAGREADARFSSECKVTLEQFGKVRFGMQLRQVNQLFGCAGRQTSGTRIAGIGTYSTYAWDGSTPLSAVTATFRGDSLYSKMQVGLE